MEVGRSKPSGQDAAQDGATSKSSSEKAEEERNPAMNIASSCKEQVREGASDSAAKITTNTLLRQQSKHDTNPQLGIDTQKMPGSHQTHIVPLSRYIVGQGTKHTPASVSGAFGTLVTSTSKEKPVPAVLIRQGGQPDKLVLYANTSIGSKSQCSITQRNELVSRTSEAKCERMSSSTVSCNEETIDRGGDSKSSSCLNLSTSNIVDAEVANLQEKDPVKSVPPVTSQQITKTLDERFLGHLGLRKIDKECQQGGSKTENAASKKDSGKEYIGIGVDQQGGAGGSMSGDGQNSKEDSDLQVKGSSRQASQPKVLPASQPLKAVSDVSKFSTIKVISPVGENSSLAELDISGMNNGISKDGQGASIPSSNSLSNPVKNSPIYIKVKLEEKDVTVICCPVALLLQHKEILDVTLQANDPNSYSITCRKCSHVVSDPYTMLQHLKVQHQIQGCLQKLLNLNSQYLSCMSQPLCVNITGVLTLPDGLSDMEQGIIRFNSMGIPKLSFVCRLCPLSFHTARGLCAHHQYFIRSRSQQTSDNSMWFCRLCPRQFQSFMDYYAHHKWMRVAKELFVSTDQVNKRKRFEVMNESGKVVASMEVPKTHSFAIKPWPVTNPDSCEDIGWGHKPSLNDRAPQGKVEPLIPEADDQAFYIDAGTPGPSTITLVSTPDGISSKQPDEADKGKRMTPPLFQTLDSLCRRLAQRVDTSTGLDKVISVGDKQIDEDHEYLCGICHKTFPRLPQMQGHMGSHVRRRRANKYAPPPPVAVASSPADPPSVERAPTVEPLDVEYKCGVCSETFPKLDQMEIHMECHNRPHQTTQPPVKSPPMKSLDTPFLETVKLMSLTCDICHWSFPTERKLWDHRSTHAQKKTEETGSSMSSRASGGIQRKTLYVCVYCKKSFAREVNLRFHLKKHSTEVADESSQTTGNVLTSPDMQAQHACSVCGRAFRSHRQLRSHMVWHAKFHKGADKPPVSLVEAGGASKKSLVCNTCDKVCCSDWELRLHKKKHASPKRLLVRHTLANEDSDPAKKRTLAQRACNLNNKEGVSDTAAPGSSTLRRSTRPRREGLYKYFCRNCRSYFQSSQQFARHMAVHTNMAGPSHRTSPGSPSNKTRGSDSGQVLMQKQSDGDVSDDSGGGIDMSWSPSPSSADEQPPPIDKLGSDTSEILTDKKVSEENENCVTTEDSGPAVEDTSQILKETAADEQSPHSSAKPTEKQNTDPVMSSAVCKGASAEMKEKILALNQGEAAEEQSVPLCSDSKVCEDVDVLMTAANQVTGSNKSSAGSEGLKILSQSKKLSANSSIWDGIMPNVETQPKAPSIVLLEDCQVKKQDRDLKTQTQTTVYENSSSVMVRVSPEGSRIAPDEQASETNEAHLQTDDQSGKELSTDASCQNTVDDTSNTVTQKKDKGSGLISTEECSASPSFNKGHVEATERPVQKNIGGHPVLPEDVATTMKQTGNDVGSSVADHGDVSAIESPLDDDGNLHIREGEMLTENQQDHELGKDCYTLMVIGCHETKAIPDELPSLSNEAHLVQDACSVMVAESQETSLSMPDLTPFVTSDKHPCEDSTSVLAAESQETSVNVLDMSSSMNSEAHPGEDTCTMIIAESEETRQSVPDTLSSVPDNVLPDEYSKPVMVTESEETRQSTPSVPPSMHSGTDKDSNSAAITESLEIMPKLPPTPRSGSTGSHQIVDSIPAITESQEIKPDAQPSFTCDELPGETNSVMVAENQETRPAGNYAPPSLINGTHDSKDCNTVVVADSQESKPLIPSAPPVISSDIHPQMSLGSFHRHNDEPCTSPTQGGNSSAKLEAMTQGIFQPPKVQTGQLQNSTEHRQEQDVEHLQKSKAQTSEQDNEFPVPQSVVMDDLRAVPEHTNQVTTCCALEEQFLQSAVEQLQTFEEKQERDIEGTLKVPSTDGDTFQTSQMTSPGQGAEDTTLPLVGVDDSDAVTVDSPITQNVFPGGVESHFGIGESPTPEQDNKLSAHSTPCDVSVDVVGVTTNQNSNPGSPDETSVEDENRQSQNSERPTCEETDELVLQIVNVNSNALSKEAESSPLLENPKRPTDTGRALVRKLEDVQPTQASGDSDGKTGKAVQEPRRNIFEVLFQKKAIIPDPVPMSALKVSAPSPVLDASPAAVEHTTEKAGPSESSAEDSVEMGVTKNTLRYTCDICNKSFSKKFQLRGHKGKHGKEGIGPYRSQQDDSGVEVCEDKPVGSVISETNKIDKDASTNSLPKEDSTEGGTSAQRKGDRPLHSTDCVDSEGEVVDVSHQTSQPTNLSLPQLTEVPGQKPVHPNLSDSATLVLTGETREVREKTSSAGASGSDGSQLQDRAFNLRSTARYSLVDMHCEAQQVDQSQMTRTSFKSSGKDKGKKQFSCPHCEKTYAHVNQLNAHKRVHMASSKSHSYVKGSSDNAMKRNVRKVYRCSICHATFYSYKKLCGHKGAHVAHKMTKFRKYSNSGSQEPNGQEFLESKPKVLEPKGTSSVLVEGSAKNSGKFTCKFCPETFQYVAQLRNHILVGHPMAKGKLFLLKPFTCELCGKAFTKSKQRLHHMKLHGRRRRRRVKKTMSLQDTDHSYYKKLPAKHGNVLAEVTGTETLKKEATVNVNSAQDPSIPDVKTSPEKTFSCQLCEKSFKCQQQLAGHMNIHKRYPCKLCTASFTLARQLCGHLKVHGGLRKRPFEENQSLNVQNQSGTSHDSSSRPSTPVQLSTASRRVTRHTTNSQSNALLKRVIKIFLTGKSKRKKHQPAQTGKWLQPKRSLQRALMKHKLVRIQNIIGILRKSIILEIDANSHRLVYECKECQRLSYCHKTILSHYLETHLQSAEGIEKVPASAISGREDTEPDLHQRFRNKSKIGCPICKGSSGFQCHLHNEEDFIAIDALLGQDEDPEVVAFENRRESSPSRSKLVQPCQDNTKRQPGDPFSCSHCPFKAKSMQSLMVHQQFHSERKGDVLPQGAPSRDSPEGEKLLSCPLCSFKVKNVFGLAAHSRVHKGKGKKRALEDEAQNPASSSSSSASPSPKVSSESIQTSGDYVKQRKNAYNCLFCPKYFHTVISYRNHMKTHEHVFQFKCSGCSQSFLTARMLEDHIKSTHSVKLPYHCSKCSFSSASYQSALSHIRSHSTVVVNRQRKADWSDYLNDVLKTRVPEAPNKVLKQNASWPAFSKEHWSAYLNAVLQTRGPEGSSASPNGSPTKDALQSLTLAGQGREAQLPDQGGSSSSAYRQKPHQEKSQTTLNLKPKDPGMRAAEAKSVVGSETPIIQDRQVKDGPQLLSDPPDEYFACSQCKDFQASTKEDWDSHINTVHKGGLGPKKLRCVMCQYTTTSQERLEQHMRLHRHQTLQCNSCKYRTPQRHLMIRHVQTVHRQHRPFKCKLCTYATAYRHHLRRHAEKHKNPNFKCRYRKLLKKGDWHSAEVSSRVICSECGRELQNKKTLRNHYIKVHGRIPGGKSLAGIPRSTQDEEDSGDMSIGTRKLPSYSVICEDVRQAPLEKLYECSVCSLEFRRRSELNQHMAQGHAETQASRPCQCPQCGLVTGSGQLQAHMLIHQEENLLQCEEESCSFKTAEAVHLQRHQAKHAAERDVSITCRLCQVKFSDADSLQMHNLQVHSEQISSISARAPFMCSLCPFVSPNEKDANRHFRLHNYNLAFKCEYCVFSTSTASAIATHQKIHRYPRRNIAATLLSKKASQQRQKMLASTSAKSADSHSSLVTGTSPERPRPKHVFVSNKGKKLYECRYCQRFFDVAEAWQRHELRHMAEWPQY